MDIQIHLRQFFLCHWMHISAQSGDFHGCILCKLQMQILQQTVVKEEDSVILILTAINPLKLWI